jgi:ferric-dicitrate binding protein FerR (iron transport regulator)
MDQLRAGIRYKQLHKSTPVKAKNRFLYWGVAASLLLLLTFYTVFHQWTDRQEASKVSHIPSLIEKRTTYGQKLTVSLPDGTLVKLNSGSSIAYPEEFSGDQREVRFSGEGFFEVEKDPERPFIIESDGVFTKVLGTSFNLRSYANEGNINVAVVTGKVEIHQLADTSVLVLPEEMGVFDKSKRQITKQVYDTAEVLAWRDGILNFNKTPLPKVLDELEKWYGVKFIMDDDVRLGGDFSGRFQHANLENVLEGIQYTSVSKFQFNIKDKKVYLTTQ